VVVRHAHRREGASEPRVNISCRHREQEQLALLQGTLDVLILRVLLFGPQHGQGIARAIQDTSEDVLLVDHGALYPALQRLEAQKWITAKWGVSANNRRARFYTLTRAGREQLVAQSNRWRRLAAAMSRVLGSEPVKS
jgi:PadR family transcriptional regulator, regulatory protein PadR